MLSPLTRAVGPFMDNEVSPILVHSMEKNDEAPTPPLKMTQTVKSGANENLTFKMGNKDLIQVGATHPLKSDSTVLAFDQNRKTKSACSHKITTLGSGEMDFHGFLLFLLNL